MTQEDIDHAIETCHWRDKVFVGNDKGDRYAVCRGCCLPCLAVIDKGKCVTLIELFKERGD